MRNIYFEESLHSSAATKKIRAANQIKIQKRKEKFQHKERWEEHDSLGDVKLLGHHFFKSEQQHESRDGRQNGASSFRLETDFESLNFFSSKDDLCVFIQFFL